MSEPATYRSQFADSGRASSYDAGEYARGSYSSLLWEIEKEFLEEFVAKFRESHQNIDYLDFACGTGRVLSFLEDFADSSQGVDVSTDMLESASGRVKKSTLICADLTRPVAEGLRRYDLVTAFRFFLNAEPSLREAAMKALAARLKDSTSALIFNNHGNPLSHKIAMWPVHQLRSIGRGYRTAGNYLTDGEIKSLVGRAGLKIKHSFGYGYLSAKIIPLLGFHRALRIERALAGRRSIGSFGVNRIYVCQLER